MEREEGGLELELGLGLELKEVKEVVGLEGKKKGVEEMMEWVRAVCLYYYYVFEKGRGESSQGVVDR